jgi:putative NADPH-quinone reductase
MARRITIIQGHPDAAGHHLLHALADAYDDGDASGSRDASRFPKRLLAGRSARLVVTMGMPVLFYRWYFGAYGIRSFERSMLRFAGIKPICESLYGLAFADERKRARWIEDMRRHGERSD